ncbi:metallo-beta-lactamase domain protein [Prevotella sp. DNF00663]|uniref:MBL fold metallo-hydrolase n=1 Tax=unclassified Prevotella TaxID=2638335 RepID=UPI000512C778|nr:MULTISPECIES: MBL fold metallo-hydrolase [unclassified Prevotella]KGI60224.1 metallo-beta-lactamase [Prevotella sp. S7 MS 2]KXB82124.1 metallo-beta-lactamase domain protein [Prevotella sp. DNF00663]
MLKFVSFGSGSSGNSYLLYTETDGLLIDAGVGIRTLKKHFKEYGFSLSQIHHILITHDHADHIKSVGSISSDYDIPVYSTFKVHAGIERNFCVRRKVAPDFVKVIEKDIAINVGEFVVTPFEVPHDSSDNVGYKIVYDDVTFCILTDVGHITEQMKGIISDANYLVIEANHDEEMLATGPYPQHLKIRISGSTGHLSNMECAKAIAENATEKLRHVWLCHLSEENNHPVLAQKTVEQTLRSYGIIAGVDFQVEVLKRKIPTGYFELK